MAPSVKELASKDHDTYILCLALVVKSLIKIVICMEQPCRVFLCVFAYVCGAFVYAVVEPDKVVHTSMMFFNCLLS